MMNQVLLEKNKPVEETFSSKKDETSSENDKDVFLTEDGDVWTDATVLVLRVNEFWEKNSRAINDNRRTDFFSMNCKLLLEFPYRFN